MKNYKSIKYYHKNEVFRLILWEVKVYEYLNILFLIKPSNHTFLFIPMTNIHFEYTLSIISTIWRQTDEIVHPLKDTQTCEVIKTLKL